MDENIPGETMLCGMVVTLLAALTYSEVGSYIGGGVGGEVGVLNKIGDQALRGFQPINQSTNQRAVLGFAG